MRLDLTEEELKDIIICLEHIDCEQSENHSHIINLLNHQIEVNKEYEKEVEESKKLEKQEIWARIFFNGYSYTFEDQSLGVHIHIPNPNFGPDDRFKGTTKVFCPINADDEGKVDLTPLLHTLLKEMKDNPGKDVKAYATGFSRQFHFNPALLSTPIPKALLDLFSIPNKDCIA